MENVTVTLDEEIASWVRVNAEQRGTDISILVSEILEEKMREEEGYYKSMRNFLSRPPSMINASGTAYPCRDTLHER